MTVAVEPAITEQAAVLSAFVSAFRKPDLGRVDPYWSAANLDAFSIECFGVSVERLVGLSAADLLRDWRDQPERSAA